MSYSNQVTSVPKTISQGEFPLLRLRVTAIIDHFIKIFNGKSFGVDNIPQSIFQKGISDFLLDYYVMKYEINSAFIFFKDPSSVKGASQVFDYFPDAKIFFTVRDGRDFVASFSKGSKLQRRRYSKIKKFEMSVKSLLRLNFILACRQFVHSVDDLEKTLESLRMQYPEREFRVFKYEDLYLQARTEIPKLFSYLNIQLSEQELDGMCNADVVGSSFYDSKKNVQNWKKAKRGKDFNPVGRWKKWNPIQKCIFNKIAGTANQRLGYSLAK